MSNCLNYLLFTWVFSQVLPSECGCIIHSFGESWCHFHLLPVVVTGHECQAQGCVAHLSIYFSLSNGLSPRRGERASCPNAPRVAALGHWGTTKNNPLIKLKCYRKPKHFQQTSKEIPAMTTQLLRRCGNEMDSRGPKVNHLTWYVRTFFINGYRSHYANITLVFTEQEYHVHFHCSE